MIYVYSSVITSRNADAILYKLKNTLLESSQFENILLLVKRLIISYGFTFQSLQGTVYFLSHLENFSNSSHLSQIEEIFQTFTDYFDRSKYFPSVVKSLGNYLVRLQISDGDLTFINFSDRVLSHLHKYDIALHESLKKKRIRSIMRIISDSEVSGQIFYALRQYTLISNSSEEDKSIRVKALRNKIRIYRALGCEELIQKYTLLLRKYDVDLARNLVK